jgi:hypothetical protein
VLKVCRASETDRTPKAKCYNREHSLERVLVREASNLWLLRKVSDIILSALLVFDSYVLEEIVTVEKY